MPEPIVERRPEDRCPECDEHHAACAHCLTRIESCVPVLLFTQEPRPGHADIEMWAVCDDCLTTRYRFGTVARVGDG